MVWARGHRSDWDYFATQAGDEAWGYESVLDIYRRIEDWHGPAVSARGTGGPMSVTSPPDPNPIAPAIVEAARSLGIPSYPSNNGAMMDRGGGAALLDVTLRNGLRQSVYRSYVHPHLHRPNMTVLTGATVTRLVVGRNRATAVEFSHNDRTHQVVAAHEVVVSLGAINTPKVLMHSGIGDADELRRFGIPSWRIFRASAETIRAIHGSTACGNSASHSSHGTTPGAPGCSGRATRTWRHPTCRSASAKFRCPAARTLPLMACRSTGGRRAPGAAPESSGRVRLTGARPCDPVSVEDNMLAHHDDLAAAIACVDLAREIGNSTVLRRFNKREVMPGDLTCRARTVHPLWGRMLFPPKLHGEDGTRQHVCGRLEPQSSWHRRASDCRRLNHASDHHRQHHGALCRHR